MKRLFILIIMIITSVSLVNAAINEINHNSKFSNKPTKTFTANDYLTYKKTNTNKVFYGRTVENDESDKRYGTKYTDKNRKYFRDRWYNGVSKSEIKFGKEISYYKKDTKSDYKKLKIDTNNKYKYKKAQYNKYNLEFRNSQYKKRNFY